ncbi:hypothetical protein I4U23_010990 [Adineta vaga]|nr:hypothetical protein I4U23_010990 [Adineta vaga]
MNTIGNWTIVKSPQYLRFNGIMIKTGYDQSLDGVAIDATVVNHLRCFVKLNPSTNPVGISATGQTIMVQQPIQSPWVDLSWAYNLGGSGSNTDHPKQYGWIRMSQTRCTGFSPSSDIGYGPCTSLS